MRLWYFLVLALLAACGPAPAPEPPPGGDTVPFVDVTPGLNDIEPDHCGAAEYDIYLGEPASVIEGVPISRAYRVIPSGGIVTQEYDAYRINFRLDPRGRIAKVDCG